MQRCIDDSGRAFRLIWCGLTFCSLFLIVRLLMFCRWQADGCVASENLTQSCVNCLRHDAYFRCSSDSTRATNGCKAAKSVFIKMYTLRERLDNASWKNYRVIEIRILGKCCKLIDKKQKENNQNKIPGSCTRIS